MGQFLQETIDSVELYKGSDIEVIIVNDGSTDTYTVNLLKKIEEEGKYQVIHQQNQGLSAARNTGIRVSKGKYYLALDADNKIRPSYIEKGINVLDADEKVGIVYGDAQFFGERKGRFKSFPFSFRRILQYNFIDACIVARKTAWENVNGYDINLPSVEDWDFNIGVAEAGWRFHYIPEILFDYRVRGDSMVRARNIESIRYCEDYIAKKHGSSYRKFFKEQITLKGHLKYFFSDLWDAITGRR
jgi:glycosyltransferase involved in cell wall biosynthesis